MISALKSKLLKKYIKYIDSNKNSLYRKHKTYRNNFSTSLRQSKKRYYNNYFRYNINNIKNTWKGFNLIIS